MGTDGGGGGMGAAGLGPETGIAFGIKLGLAAVCVLRRMKGASPVRIRTRAGLLDTSVPVNASNPCAAPDWSASNRAYTR